MSDFVTEGYWRQIVELQRKLVSAEVALMDIQYALQCANDMPDGPIQDTIWMPVRDGEPYATDTLFNYINDAIENIKK